MSAARDLLTDNGVKRAAGGKGEKTAACVRLALVHAAAAVQENRMEGRTRGSGGFRSRRRPTPSLSLPKETKRAPVFVRDPIERTRRKSSAVDTK